jgi:hypothetical protein
MAAMMRPCRRDDAICQTIILKKVRVLAQKPSVARLIKHKMRA